MFQERHIVGGLLLLMLFTMGLNFMAVAPLLPLIMQSYDVSQTTASLLIGAVSLVLAVGMAPAGMLAARLGVKRSLVVGGFLVCAGALIPLAPGFSVVLVLRLIFSLGAALLIPVSAVLIMQWFPPSELPLWNAASGAVQSIGLTISMFFAAPLANAFGWQAPLALYGTAALVSALAWVMLGRDKAGITASAPSLRDNLVAFRERNTLLLALAFFGPIAQFTALSSWLPTFYSTERGMTLSEAGAMVSLLSLIGIPSTLAGGILPQRLGLRRPFVLGCGALVGISGAGTYLLPSTPLIIASVMVVGVCSWLFFPVLATSAMELPGMSPAKVGVVLAVAIGLGNLAGFVSPLLVGFLADATGSFVPGFLVWSALSTSLLVAGLLLPETGPRGKRPRAATSQPQAGVVSEA